MILKNLLNRWLEIASVGLHYACKSGRYPFSFIPKCPVDCFFLFLLFISIDNMNADEREDEWVILRGGEKVVLIFSGDEIQTLERVNVKLNQR